MDRRVSGAFGDGCVRWIAVLWSERWAEMVVEIDGVGVFGRCSLLEVVARASSGLMSAFAFVRDVGLGER